MFLRRAARLITSLRFPSRTEATTCRTAVFSSIPQSTIFMGINGNLALAEDVGTGNIPREDDSTTLRRIEDGSVVSNIHTSKWRVFTDNGRDLFLQGKLDKAENYFLLALQEAKQGFGDRDPHVASACNNLAELYRVKRLFDKAEPLYLEAINLLEESFGPDDIRVGAALHNLGQFYLVQRKLEEARMCYERALKIKGRVLGLDHPDYADTMYHLGMVLYLQGNEKDAEALIRDSIRILEEAGLGESVICLRRLRHLAQGWNSLDTVIAAESLALTLQSVGKLKEAEELLERCLDIRKTILHEDHIQIAANMLHLARVAMLKSNKLRKVDIAKAITELDKAKVLLDNSIRIAQRVLDSRKQNGSKMPSRDNGKDERTAMVILLQSLDALGLLEITKQELLESRDECCPTGAKNALEQCISAFKEYGMKKPVAITSEVKAEYLSCLKHLLGLIIDCKSDGTQHSKQELKEEIRLVEAELSANRKHAKK
ncbi:hypothetical protein NE237_006029 [Protea cynaroides]|uniref:Kinesin light chain n=1 Tax=Protea cynaroides TaxID=273540 RepID=A0A9Q0QV16_9MAGN|nr:hypothetical protein NE237_006029 [Protea cynaroides]